MAQHFALVLLLTTSLVSSTVLEPVSRHHPARIASKRNTPSYDITLHYAEATYKDEQHYASTVEWIMNNPTIVINDDPFISSFQCGATGESVTWNSQKAYEEALDTWSTPMFVVVEDNHGNCKSVDDGDETYDVFRLDRIIKRDDAARTILFDATPSTWGLAAKHHSIFVGKKKAVSLPGHHTKRADPRREKLDFGVNYDWAHNRKLESLEILDYTQDNSNLEFATSNAVLNLLINVVIDVAKLYAKIASFVSEFVGELTGGIAALSTKVTGNLYLNQMKDAMELAIKKLIKDTINDSKSKTKHRQLTAEEYINALNEFKAIRNTFYDKLTVGVNHIKKNNKKSIGNIEKLERQYRNGMGKIYIVTKEEIERVALKAGVPPESLPNSRRSLDSSALGFAVGSTYPLEAQRLSLRGLILSSTEGAHAVSQKRADQLVRRATGNPKDYLSLKGNLNANLDLKVIVKGTVRKDVFTKTLKSILLKGIKIPNVITIGPELDLEGIISVLAEGDADFDYGGSLVWNDVEIVYNLADMSKAENSKIPDPIIKPRPEKENKVNRGKLGLGLGVALEPRLLFSVALELAGKAAAVRGGLGVRFGVDLVATVGSIGGFPGAEPPAKDTCPHGVELKFRLQKTIPSLIYGKGEKKDLKHHQIGSIPGKNLFSHCFDLSPALCGPDQLFHAWSSPSCTKKHPDTPSLPPTS
ncbi:hypothetical protein T439DRAFT_330788 [Meredithblackwellia eburnea MCA 4105]